MVAGAGPSTRVVHGFGQHSNASVLGTPIAEISDTVPGNTQAMALGHAQPSVGHGQIQPPVVHPERAAQVKAPESTQASVAGPEKTNTNIGDIVGMNQTVRPPAENNFLSSSNNEGGLGTYQTRQAVNVSSQGTEQLGSLDSGAGPPKEQEQPPVAPDLSNKVVMNELRCPSLMNGSLVAESPEEGGPNTYINQPTEDITNITTEKATVEKEVKVSTNDNDTTPGNPPLTSPTQDAGDATVALTATNDKFDDSSKEKEILINWGQASRNGKEEEVCDNLGVRLNKPGDSSMGDELPKRMDSMSEGYADLVRDFSSPKVSQSEKGLNQSSTKPAVTPTSSGTSVNQVGVVTMVDVSRTDTSASSWSSEVAKTEGSIGYQASPNLSPQRGPIGSPYRQSSPRPESIKGLDISDRYKIPRCDSSDSVPGSMSDSVRTTDSLRQRFGRWDSTDSADVRSITSNSSFGEAVSSPTLPQPSIEKKMNG